MNPSPSVKPSRNSWTEDGLLKAVEAVRSGELSTNKASKTFCIPRRTLREYLAKNTVKKLTVGRKPVLSVEDEKELVSRIKRLAAVGYPLTPRAVRMCVFSYCKSKNIKTPFSDAKKEAGRYWFKGFMTRNKDVAVRKCQNLNPARAQKLNRFIVQDHFQKIRSTLADLNITSKPQSIYNLDEKGIRLCLHKEPKVMAQSMVKMQHLLHVLMLWVMQYPQ